MSSFMVEFEVKVILNEKYYEVSFPIKVLKL
jgi:hypothetical protein